MKILHTSDWHLGRSLYGKKRYTEFEQFLDWLAGTIESETIDALLVAGDIFDTTTPSNRTQELYYKFLCRVANSQCQNIIIIAGNHDSPSFLNAPKELLRFLNVHVVGAKTENPEDEVITLFNKNQEVEALVCAVPYLRDREIRTIEPGETIDDKNRKIIEGIKNHYQEICDIAVKKRSESQNIPIIAMGHLFTAGGQTTDGDGVRELYIGSLAHIHPGIFPESINYVALGHLHVPQTVGGKNHIRYSGSPLPMGFGESNQKKKVIIVEFKKDNQKISEIPVPVFQKLAQISGDMVEVQDQIEELKQINSTAWLEIIFTGKITDSHLRDIVSEAIEGTGLKILRIKNKSLSDRLISKNKENETLDDLTLNDVFKRCLESFEIDDEEKKGLSESYHEIIKYLLETDSQAE